jgi:hypothetical protein
MNIFTNNTYLLELKEHFVTFLSAFLVVKMFTEGESIQSVIQRRFCDWHIKI